MTETGQVECKRLVSTGAIDRSAAIQMGGQVGCNFPGKIYSVSEDWFFLTADIDLARLVNHLSQAF